MVWLSRCSIRGSFGVREIPLLEFRAGRKVGGSSPLWVASFSPSGLFLSSVGVTFRHKNIAPHGALQLQCRDLWTASLSILAHHFKWIVQLGAQWPDAFLVRVEE